MTANSFLATISALESSAARTIKWIEESGPLYAVEQIALQGEPRSLARAAQAQRLGYIGTDGCSTMALSFASELIFFAGPRDETVSLLVRTK